MFKILSCFVCVLLLSVTVPAQNRSADHDEEYYETFEEQITTRLYLGKKYTSLTLKAPNEIQSLRYRPNSLVTMGINGSYKSLSLSFGSAFGFLNPNKEEKGKTRSFDFQTHLYSTSLHAGTQLHFEIHFAYFLLIHRTAQEYS